MERPLLKRGTAADAVYDELKKDIVYLKYKPGEKLSEARLAENYGVSRDPVRKAISRLVQEGLVLSRPQYGTIVSEVSIQQGVDICDIRLLLETYAIRNAVKAMKEEVIDSLIKDQESIERRMYLQDDETVRQEIYALDGKMHRSIYDASGNSMIANIIASYEYITKRIQIVNLVWHSRKEATMKEMRSIIEALKARDEGKAVEAMELHIRNIKETVISQTVKKEIET